MATNGSSGTSTDASPTRAPTGADPLAGPRADLARVIPRRRRTTWWLGLVLAIAFGALLTPAITANKLVSGRVVAGQPAPITVRVPPFAGYVTRDGRIGGGGGVVIARGDVATPEDARHVAAIADAMPHGPAPYVAYFLLACVLGGLFAHHLRRSNRGRLVRVQVVSLALVVIAAICVKLLVLATALSVLVVPVALFAIVPTVCLDRVVGLACGTLAALVVALLVPFDMGVAILLLVQAGAAGLVVAERPKRRWRAIVSAGLLATLLTALTYPLLVYLTTGHLPLAELSRPLHSAWVAAAIGPALATVLAAPLVPLYQLLVGEITDGRLVALEDLSHPLLKQIAARAPGTWQHSLTMANMAEIAANAIGANGRLVRVGAYFHDLGKSLSPKHFIENIEPGETSPHDQLAPEVSCDAIFAHVTEGIVTARKARLHERIVDFMHMHHGNGVLEYFWAKCREQGNPLGLTIDHFRYPGVPPQSRETAILAICDAVEAAARTLKKPDAAAIDSLVQRIVYGKLHLGQLDESGLSMSDLRRIADSLRETIRHANHGRIEYPWQKAQQDASASPPPRLSQSSPRLDSLDRPARSELVRAQSIGGAATATTERSSRPSRPSDELALEVTAPQPQLTVNERPRADSPIELVAKRPGEPPASMKRPSEPPASMKRPSEPPASVKRPSEPPMTAPAAPADRDAGTAQSWRSDGASGARDRAPRTRSAPVSAGPGTPEAAAFAADAIRALEEASKDIVVLRDPESVPRAAGEPAPDPVARTRAAALPAIASRRAPTVPPAVGGRRSPTLPPLPAMRPPPGAGATVPAIRGVPASDEAITIPPPFRSEDASRTEPRLPRRAADPERTATRGAVVPQDADTEPRLELPLPAPAASLPDLPAPPPESRWARGLAERIDAQLDERIAEQIDTPFDEQIDAPFDQRLYAPVDDEFGAATPVHAPARADLQALVGAAPDLTRRQSLDELEALHRASREQRPSDPELELGRRPPPRTAEITDDDIEAAIELAPAARRSSLGIAKKKPE